MPNISVEGDEALFQPADEEFLTIWKRHPLSKVKPGFVVEVVIEGYRPMKEHWTHGEYPFTTLAEALQWDWTLGMALPDAQEEILEFKSIYGGNGWYGFSLENTHIYEIDAHGQKHEWVRERPWMKK